MTFEVYNLSNNLKLVSCHMPSFRTVSINFIVGVGSRYESEGQEGISHFLEHMAFKGTISRSAYKIAKEFDEIGGLFNAYTSKEHTVYHAKVLDIHLEKALQILADIILNSLYDPEEIKKEYGVICQEIAQTEDSPDDLCYENLVNLAFNEQPLGKSILGTVDSIAQFTHDSFQSYVSEFYSSSNAVLSVAGNFDINLLTKLSQDLFGALPSKNTQKPFASSYSSGMKFVTKDLEQTTIFTGYKSTSYLDITPFYHIQMLSLILGGGFSSRLFQSIREKQGLAYSVGSFNASYSDNGIFSLYASCGHEKIPQVINSIMDEIHKIIDYISPEEIDLAKNQLKALILMSEEKTTSKASEYGKNYLIFGRYIPLEEILERIEVVEPKDLTKAAKIVFSSEPVLSIVSRLTPDISLDNLKVKL